MKLKIAETRDALHPSEIVVIVTTKDGSESLVVDRRSVSDNLLEVGQPIGQENTEALIELPRETYSGAWRVWVSRDSLAA